VEGYPARPISDADIKDYLHKLSDTIGAVTLIAPVTQCSDRYGWAGWIHWGTSGAHFYAWDRPVAFFSVDIRTCRDFSVLEAIEFTREYFNANRLSYKSH
jgi:S-adenosylmethionine decarboxylase